MTIEVVPLEGLPEVEPGDDLAAFLEPSLTSHAANDGDVVAITQKVVSKAEGRIVSGADRASWVARESVDVVARRGDLVITRTRHGFVCANAGVDASNVRQGFLTLLPEDPDASAERLQKELSTRLGLARLGVVVTDTFGRPWREGVVDVAIGCAGLPAILDLRGTTDDRGTILETTVVALADAVAAASGLVMTKAARVPAALVRGLDPAFGDAPPGSARDLVRAPADDLFRESALMAVSHAVASEVFGPGDVPRELVEEAVRATTGLPSAWEWSFVAVDSVAARRRLLGVTDDAHEMLRTAPVLIVPCLRAPVETSEQGILLAAGATIRSFVVSLHALGLAWSWHPDRPFPVDAARGALALEATWRPLGIVGIGPAVERPPERPVSFGDP